MSTVSTSSSLRRSPAQGRSEERIERILVAAAHLISQTKPETVTTTQIAEAAGMSVGSVYRYFADVDAVFQALLHRSIADLTGRVRAAGLSLLGTQWRENLGRALDAQIDYLQDLDTGFHALWFASSGALAHAAATTTRSADEALVSDLVDELPAERRERLGDNPYAVVRLAIGILTKGTELAFSAVETRADPWIVAETKKAVVAYLSSYFDEGEVDRPRARDAP